MFREQVQAGDKLQAPRLDLSKAKKGNAGTLHGHFVVLQKTSDTEAIVYAKGHEMIGISGGDANYISSNIGPFLFRGCDATNGLADGSKFWISDESTDVYNLSGTYRYADTRGAITSILIVEPIDVAIPEKPSQIGVESRLWKDKSGKFEVEAKYADFEKAKVHLLKSDGKKLQVPLVNLGESDVQYVRGLLNADKTYERLIRAKSRPKK